MAGQRIYLADCKVVVDKNNEGWPDIAVLACSEVLDTVTVVLHPEAQPHARRHLGVEVEAEERKSAHVS